MIGLSQRQKSFLSNKVIKFFMFALVVLSMNFSLSGCNSDKNSSSSSRMTLSDNEITLVENETYQLEVTYVSDNLLNKEIIWESEDSSIAIVNDGLVKAISEGRTIIKAKCDREEATCIVNVEKNKISYIDVVNRLYSEKWKAKKSNMGETTYQWSTNDPDSVYNEETGKYEAWDANDDGSFKIRDEDNNSVTIDIKGSGYVSRMWFAQIYRGGTITVVVDGEVVVYQDLLEYITGYDSNGFSSDGDITQSMSTGIKSIHKYKNLSYASSKGFNSFIPITFSKSILIYFTNDTRSSNYDAASFKQISYTLFNDNREVEGFAGLDYLSDDCLEALKTANEANEFTLADLNNNFKVKALEEVEVYNKANPGAISLITMELPEVQTEDLKEVLRYTYIKAYWDDISLPAIELSLGDFFGSPAEVKDYKTINIGVTKDNIFYARFYMPFEKARILIGNKLNEEVSINIDFEDENITKDEANESMRFCASWQKCSDRDLNCDRWPDSTTLTLTGSGRLVGQYWHTYQLFEGFWWGEGDERIFVDGEKTPSWAGTGAEDVIGYAYAIPYSWEFSTLFRAHPVGAKESGNVGDKINVLMFGNDAVAFDTSLEMSLEKYWSDDYCLLSAVSYYYLNAEHVAQNYKGPYDVEARTSCAPLNLKEAQMPSLYRYEGEFLNGFAEISRGTKYPQELGIAWSGRKQLCWFNCGNGMDDAYLSIPISVKEDGNYNISVGFTTASDYAKFDIYLDEKRIAQGIDLYTSTLSRTDIELGLQNITAGEHIVKFVVAGANPNVNLFNGAYVFGLDYIDIVPENMMRIEASDIQRLNLKTSGGEIRHETPDNSSPTNGNYLTFLNSARENGYISFDVNFKEDGNYSIDFSFIKAFDFPIVTIYLDGEQIGEPIDLYHAGLKATGNINLVTKDISKGTHTFTVKTASKNSKSAGYVFSIDHIDIIKNS